MHAKQKVRACSKPVFLSKLSSFSQSMIMLHIQSERERVCVKREREGEREKEGEKEKKGVRESEKEGGGKRVRKRE